MDAVFRLSKFFILTTFIAMQILEVGRDPQRQREFLMLPVRLYKGNSYWIRPLDKDVEDTFNPKKNKNFKK